MNPSAGAKLRQAMAEEQPLQIVGTATAFSALLAEQAGFKAIYLSGAGVANSSYGLPDLGMTSMNDVAEDVRRISGACSNYLRKMGKPRPASEDSPLRMVWCRHLFLCP